MVSPSSQGKSYPKSDLPSLSGSIVQTTGEVNRVPPSSNRAAAQPIGSCYRRPFPGSFLNQDHNEASTASCPREASLQSRCNPNPVETGTMPKSPRVPEILKPTTPGPSATLPPLSSSPSPLTVSSGIITPAPPVPLAPCDDLADIRQQIAKLLDAQDTIKHRLEAIEESLLRLQLEHGSCAGPPGSSDKPSSVGGLQSLTDNMARADCDHADMVEAPPTIHAPLPRQPSASFDKQFMEITMSDTAPSAQPGQAPPPLIPLAYRLDLRARPRSFSPIFQADLLRPGTFTVPSGPPPPDRPELFPSRHPIRPTGAASRPITDTPLETETRSQPERPIAATDTATAAPSTGSVSGRDINKDKVHHKRRRRASGDAFVDTTEPPRSISAPTGRMDGEDAGPSWYLPAATGGTQPSQAESVLLPGQTFPSQPQVAPIAPGPIVVSTFHDMLDLLRVSRQGQLAGLEQQGEIVTYLRRLNQWLEWDVHDRNAKIQGMSARVEQTRDEIIALLNQMIAQTGAGRELIGTPAAVVPPPGPGEPGGPPPVTQYAILPSGLSRGLVEFPRPEPTTAYPRLFSRHPSNFYPTFSVSPVLGASKQFR